MDRQQEIEWEIERFEKASEEIRRKLTKAQNEVEYWEIELEENESKISELRNLEI